MTKRRTRIGEIGRAFKERGGKYEMRINYLRDIEDDAEDIDSINIVSLGTSIYSFTKKHLLSKEKK